MLDLPSLLNLVGAVELLKNHLSNGEFIAKTLYPSRTNPHTHTHRLFQMSKHISLPARCINNVQYKTRPNLYKMFVCNIIFAHAKILEMWLKVVQALQLNSTEFFICLALCYKIQIVTKHLYRNPDVDLMSKPEARKK